MLLVLRRSIITAAAFLLVISSLAIAGQARELSSYTAAAVSLIPGQETRYTLKFSAATALDLGKGAALTVEFPAGFALVHEDSFAPDPGCTLARLEYKNPGDHFYAVVYGTVRVKKAADAVQCSFYPQTMPLIIPAGTELYLVVPGVINAPAPGVRAVKIRITEAGGTEYTGDCSIALGLPPAAVRKVRLVDADSYTVQLAWDPAADAKRYRVVFSSRPGGEFISALDMTREPAPGEEWQLTRTRHSFAGRGNGGLHPGGKYYFKVLAGNEFGFGPASPVVRAVLPEVKPVLKERQRMITVWPGQDAVVDLDQPVKIADESGIRVYDKGTGLQVREVRALIDEKNDRMLRVKAKLRPGREYLLVAYEGALESRDKSKVVNNNFSFALAAGGR